MAILKTYEVPQAASKRESVQSSFGNCGTCEQLKPQPTPGLLHKMHWKPKDTLEACSCMHSGRLSVAKFRKAAPSEHRHRHVCPKFAREFMRCRRLIPREMFSAKHMLAEQNRGSKVASTARQDLRRSMLSEEASYTWRLSVVQRHLQSGIEIG